MPATTSVNNMTVVHKSSSGNVMFTPDVCKTPSPPGAPVPIPYPNSAMSADTDKGSKKVTIDGNPIMLQGSEFRQSTGDEAGSVGGVVSGVTKGKAEFINFSFDVTIEGKPVARLNDHMLGNKGSSPNTPPSPEMQPPNIAVGGDFSPKDKDSLTVQVVDRAGNGVPDVQYKVRTPDGKEKSGTTGKDGKIKVDDTVIGVGQVALTEVHGAYVDVV